MLIKKNPLIEKRKKALDDAIKNGNTSGLVTIMDELAECLIRGRYHIALFKVEDTDSELIKTRKIAVNKKHIKKQFGDEALLSNNNSFKSYEGVFFLKGLPHLKTADKLAFVRVVNKVITSPTRYPQYCNQEIEKLEKEIGQVENNVSMDDQIRALIDIREWKNNWQKFGFRERTDNVHKEQRMQKKAAKIVKYLIRKDRNDVFSILEDNEKSLTFFPFSWLHRFGRFVAQGFIDDEQSYYLLLEQLYQVNPYCCLGLISCQYNVQPLEKGFSDPFKEKCKAFIDRATMDFIEKDEMLVAHAHGINFLYIDDDEKKKHTYHKLFQIINRNAEKFPSKSLSLLRMLIFYSKKERKSDFNDLLKIFRICLTNLSAEEAFANRFANITEVAEIIENSAETEANILDVMMKIESLEKSEAIGTYTRLALQKNKSEEFIGSCMARIEALLQAEIRNSPEEAAKMLSHIGQTTKHNGRDDEFPVTMKLVTPMLEKIYKANPESVQAAKVIYGSHGSGSFQHQKYVELYEQFIKGIK